MKTSVILLAVVAALSAAGCAYVLYDGSSADAYTVTYMHDGQTIGEVCCNGVHIVIDPDPSLFRDCIFIGWSADGVILMPGQAIEVSCDTVLLALTAAGIVPGPDGTVAIDVADIAGGTLTVDLRCIAGPIVRADLSAATAEALHDTRSSLELVLDDGTVLVLDAAATAGIRALSAGAEVHIGLLRQADGLDLDITSGNRRLTDLDGTLSVTLPFGKGAAASVRAYPPAAGRTAEAEVTATSTSLSFSVGEPGYRYALLHAVGIRDTQGRTMGADDADRPELQTGSADFAAWGMFSAGDTFTVSGSGYGFEVTGADVRDGVHTVTGDGDVVLTARPGSYTHRVILPSEQTGYRLTADPETVEHGGGCTVRFELLSGYTDKGMLVRVDGAEAGFDTMGRLFLTDVRSDRVITVSGILDSRTYRVVLPSEQTGYTLTASAAEVNHGGSCTLDLLLHPDYERGPDFSFRVNGVERDIGSGTLVLTDITAEQEAEVAGVRLITYGISHGEHVTLKVNGYVTGQATCRDVIEVCVHDGYAMPAGYDASLPDTVHPVEGGSGYKVTGDSEFPGVFRITVGENVNLQSRIEDTVVFVSSFEYLKIEPESGYSLPDGYIESLLSEGSIYDSEYGLRCNCDFILKSIFKVSYLIDSEVFITVYYADKDVLSSLEKQPSKKYYTFKKWIDCPPTVCGDVEIHSEWDPIYYQVKFGANIDYTIRGKTHTNPGSYELCVEDTIKISPQETYELPELSTYLPKQLISQNIDGDVVYRPTGDCEFKSVCKVVYKVGSSTLSFYYPKDSVIDIYHNKSPELVELFSEFTGNFLGWDYIGNPIGDTWKLVKDIFLEVRSS